MPRKGGRKKIESVHARDLRRLSEAKPREDTLRAEGDVTGDSVLPQTDTGKVILIRGEEYLRFALGFNAKKAQLDLALTVLRGESDHEVDRIATESLSADEMFTAVREGFRSWNGSSVDAGVYHEYVADEHIRRSVSGEREV